jgi:multidrug efflux pump subunit AcrA (membrane-fusion protein)
MYCVHTRCVCNCLQGQESAQAAIEERGAAQRELAEMKMNLELAGTKTLEASNAAAAQKAELEATSANLLSAQQREASLQQQIELSALELAQEREMAVAAAEGAELRTEQLIEELDLLKRTKTSNSDEAEAAHITIKELRMRLVSAEEECGETFPPASYLLPPTSYLLTHPPTCLGSACIHNRRRRTITQPPCPHVARRSCAQVNYSARLTSSRRRVVVQAMAPMRVVPTLQRSKSCSSKLRWSKRSACTHARRLPPYTKPR